MATPTTPRGAHILHLLEAGAQLSQAEICRMTGYSNNDAKSALSGLRKRPNRLIHICRWIDKDGHLVAVYAVGDRPDADKDSARPSIGNAIDGFMREMCRPA